MKKRQLLTMVLAGAMVMGTVGYGTPVLADSEKKDVKLGVSIMELTAYPWFQGVVGVRWEKGIAVTESGCEVLSPEIGKLYELEF